MRVAVLGTGIMGSAMATSTARAGHEVVVWNRTREAAEETGLEIADMPNDAVRGADAVLTMLPTAEIVEDVVRDVDNAWLLSLLEGLAETLALAEAQGFDGTQLLEAIAGGPLDVPYAQLKGKAMLRHEYPPSFPLRLAAKDAQLVLQAAARGDVELPAFRATAAQFERAAAEHGDEDLAAVYEVTRGA